MGWKHDNGNDNTAIVVHQTDLLLCFALVVTTLVLVFCVQLLTHAVFRVCARCNYVRWYYVGCLCVLILFVASLYLGLTLYITTLALGFTAVACGRGGGNDTCGHSWRGGLAVFVLCFVLAALCVPSFSQNVRLAMPTDATTWVSLYYGQVALWPLGTAVGPENVLIVHDRVTLARMPREGVTTHTSVQHEARTQTSFVRSLVSLGGQTRIYALEGDMNAVSGPRRTMHHISLLGAHSKMVGTTIRCGLPTSDRDGVNISNIRCLSLASDVVFVNVSFELYDSSGQLVFSQGIDRADGCLDALKQLHRFDKLYFNDEESLLTCLPRVRSHGFLQLLEDPRIVPPILRSEVPHLLQWFWYMLEVLRSTHKRTAYIVEYVVAPGVRVAVVKLFELSGAARIYLFYLLENAYPYAVTLSEIVKVLATGIYCAAAEGVSVSFCGAKRREFSGDWRYLLGGQILNTARSVAQLALDVVDVVPGLWAAHSWALRAEWRLTVFCARVGKMVVVTGYMDVVKPLFSLLGRTDLFFLLKGPVKMSWLLDVAGLFFPVSWFGSALTYFWRLELLWLTTEMQLLGGLLRHLCVLLIMGLEYGWRVVDTVRRLVFCVWGLYATTTLFSHFATALIQTVVILIAMRNELRIISVHEREKYPAFLTRYAGGMYVIMLANFTKVHSVTAMHYVGAHLAMFFMLMGLSILSFLSRLYNTILFLVFPCVSSYVCLQFFMKSPGRVDVVSLSVVKGVLVIFFDHTIVKLVAHVVCDVCLLFCVALLVFGLFEVWQRGLHVGIARVGGRLLLNGVAYVLASTADERVDTAGEVTNGEGGEGGEKGEGSC